MSAVEKIFRESRRRAAARWSATCRPATRPSTARWSCCGAMVEGGCDLLEVGVPVLRPGDGRPHDPGGRRDRAARPACGCATCSSVVERVAAAGGRAVVMTYWNPVLRYGVDAFARDLAAAGGLGVITPDLIPDEAEEWLAASDGPRPRPDLPRRAVVDRGAASPRPPPRAAASSTPPPRWASPARGTPWPPSRRSSSPRCRAAHHAAGRRRAGRPVAATRRPRSPRSPTA